MLKNSARNCIEKRSLIGRALKTEKSNLAKPGPRVVPWLPPRIGTFVKQPGVAAAPIGQGCWKAAPYALVIHLQTLAQLAGIIPDNVIFAWAVAGRTPEVLGRTVSGHSAGDLTRDDVLDDFTLHWLTNTAVSAARFYWESHINLYNAADVSIPAAVSVFPGENYLAPRSWTERAYQKLIYYNKANQGGHYAAWEQPEIFSQEVRAGFRPPRKWILNRQSRFAHFCTKRGGAGLRKSVQLLVLVFSLSVDRNIPIRFLP